MRLFFLLVFFLSACAGQAVSDEKKPDPLFIKPLPPSAFAKITDEQDAGVGEDVDAGKGTGTQPVSLPALDFRLDQSRQGVLTHTMQESRTIVVSAYLTVSGPSLLYTLHNGELWLLWERDDGRDATPLRVDGHRETSSMVGSDPKAMHYVVEAVEGDEFVLFLHGDIGGGAYLWLRAGTINKGVEQIVTPQ